ncbi:MAG: BatD protein [Flavobacterium sp.]|uniref:BatD family protein n=1 Tax=unclassified Flavobacterium TaxID=196869 RepID=UPI000C58C102|nr:MULTISPECIES: BatD family protein [unclassified Flavobacterium]MBF02247.1 BatD protein [Flavobacterium sp.]MCO6161639.1 BatD family protein [Flavobacterium sp. NRK F7]
MKRVFIILLLFIQTALLAQEIKFEAKVSKSTIGLNERLQVTFAINEDGDNFQAPNFEGFRVVGGPFQSTNFSWVNGVKSFSRSYAYVLQPTQKGTLTIKQGIIEFEGQTYKTLPVKVTVTDAVELPKDPNDPDYKVGEGVHLVAEVSNGNPYLNEPVTVIYKLYFNPRFQVRNVQEVDNPKYNGFWSQQINIDKLEAVQGKYDGQDYALVVWRKVILYPQESGAKPLEPLTINLDIDVPTGRRNFFMEPEYQSVTKTISAGAKTINVKPLPEAGKPLSFSGAVGKFSFEVQPSKTELRAGESLDLEIKVSGTGNLKLFTLPKTEFPSAFEVFDPEHKEEVNTPLSGMNGTISDTYTIIPQFKGKYTLKPIEFSYFDLGSKSYKTISSEAITINVLDNPNFTSSKQDVTSNDANKQKVVKNNTFQFIKLKSDFVVRNQNTFFGTQLFYGLVVAPFLFIPLIVLGRKKKEAIDADEFGNKIRRNNKLAKKYLSEAKKQLGNKIPFYMAMEKALHNFLKAKLHIETSEMSKENIQEILENKQAQNETITQFIQLMNDCEFARYAPSTNVAMQQDFEKAVTLISELEKQL